MVDVLLVQPPIRDFYLTRKRTIPYGLASIAASLIEQGFSVEILDALATGKSHIIDLPKEMSYLREFYAETDQSPFALFYHYRHFGYSYQHIEAAIKKSKAFLIGISSLFTPYAEEALKIAEIAKKALPRCRTVMGGHHPTSLPEETMLSPYVDFVVRGEGEEAMSKLAIALQKRQNIDQIPGIVYKLSNSNLIASPPALLDNLDAMPLPATNLVKQKYYQRYKKGSAVIMAGRGCPLKCAYCSVSADSYLIHRKRSVESVIKEMHEVFQKHGVRFFDFEDENLSIDSKWFLRLLDQICKEFGSYDIELRAMNGLLPSALNEEIIEKMKAAGFRELNLSLCSISPHHLKLFKRPNVKNSFEKVLDLAKSYGLRTVGYIIIGGPGQDPIESIQDLVYLASKNVLAGLSVFYPSPGSKSYQSCEELDLLPDNLSLTRSTAIPISHTTNRLQTVTLLRLGRILNYIKKLCDKRTIDNHRDETIGKEILRKYLEDGKIRGVNDRGEIYFHNIDHSLSLYFLGELKKNRELLSKIAL